MNMFDNYGNDSYTAYNLTPPRVSKTVQRYISSPLISYDTDGNIVAFTWDPQDKFSLKLSLGVLISVLPNSIIYTSKGVKPDKYTSGVVGQRAYNTIDGKSWVCKGTVSENTESGDWIPLDEFEEELPDWIPLSNTMLKSKARTYYSNPLEDVENTATTGIDEYIWEEDNLLTYSTYGTENITIIPDMSDKIFRVTFMNFRHEVIYSYDFEGSATADIQIGPDVTSLLVEGQFFINTYILSDNTVNQCNQYQLTIIENPCKWIFDTSTNVTYITETTIQVDTSNAQYVWEPLGATGDNDYVWIPISNSLSMFNASFRKI